MKKPITSRDSRKPRIMLFLKKLTGATRISCVYQVGENTFQGHCLKREPNGSFSRLGDHKVEIKF
jgi:hypothetical protein